MDRKNKKKIELLAPVGNFEKLKIAIHYGADAVYFSEKSFSLRNFSGNFTKENLLKAVKYARSNGVKSYIACNIYSRNTEQEDICNYLHFLSDVKPDGVIIADPGIIASAVKIIPDIPIHLSTQANTTNYNTAIFWENRGVTRVNIARELSLDEIIEINQKSKIETEVFIHGAMCISYSGRCLLSSFLSQRDSNRGECSHPCRWKYNLVEELRPNDYMPVYEDDRGTYIFNSKDLCMIEHIPELIEAGICSLKIEGRMKGINYLASVVKTYREAIDDYYQKKEAYSIKKEWITQLGRINNRGYCTGFFYNNPSDYTLNYTKEVSGDVGLFVGIINGSDSYGFSLVEVRNKIFLKDRVEILKKKGAVENDTIKEILNHENSSIEFAQPGNHVKIKFNNIYSVNDLIRRI